MASTSLRSRSQPAHGTDEQRPQQPQRFAYAAVLGAGVLCYLALGAVLRLLPDYVPRSLGGGSVLVGVAVGAPSLTGAICRPLGGRLTDSAGPRRFLMLGALGMAAGAVLAFGPGTALLLGSRLAVGGGEGLMMAAAVLWLLQLAGADRRARALGHIGLANYAGLAGGPLLTDALGATHPGRIFAAAAILPLAGAAVALRGYEPPAPVAPDATQRAHVPAGALLRETARPGIGLMLVNVGYVALLSFGGAAAAQHGLGTAAVVPVFAVTVIASRALLAGLPDRIGAARSLAVFAVLEAAGLALVGIAGAPALLMAGVAVAALGQALAVPSLGALALENVPAARHGAAAGMFFAYFDAGVGLGGPVVGAAAAALRPAGGMLLASAAVTLAVPSALVRRGRSRTIVLDG